MVERQGFDLTPNEAPPADARTSLLITIEGLKVWGTAEAIVSLGKLLTEREREVDRLRTALEFYADEPYDDGEVAAAALAPQESREDG